MEIRLVDVQNCGGVVVTVKGKTGAPRVVEVKIVRDVPDVTDSESSDEIRDASAKDPSHS